MIKVRTVAYDESQLAPIIAHPVLKVNLENIRQDFENCYDGFLSQEMELTEPQIMKLKTDIFIAYLMGTANAVDFRTAFRLGYIPPEGAPQESKIYTGEEKIIQQDKKIILT